jgi:hypothetical protein
MIGAAFLAFKTRNVPSAFDESQHIANAIFLLIFFAVIIVPLDILVQENPNASIIIQGIGQCFLGIMLLVVLFGPKLYYIASGKANDKKMLEVATSTGTKGATGRKGSAPVTKQSTGSASPVTTKSNTVTSTAGNKSATNAAPSNSSVELLPVTVPCSTATSNTTTTVSSSSELFSSISSLESKLSTYSATDSDNTVDCADYFDFDHLNSQLNKLKHKLNAQNQKQMK